MQLSADLRFVRLTIDDHVMAGVDHAHHTGIHCLQHPYRIRTIVDAPADRAAVDRMRLAIGESLLGMSGVSRAAGPLCWHHSIELVHAESQQRHRCQILQAADQGRLSDRRRAVHDYADRHGCDVIGTHGCGRIIKRPVIRATSVAHVSELEMVRADHAPMILTFERENRAYFARSISDRGDDYFAQFTQRYKELLADQAAGTSASYVLLTDVGVVAGRFNLYRIGNGTAELGYRVAENAAGRGTATAAVKELCRLAASRHRLSSLTAATSNRNIASQRVLVKAGFVLDRPADPADVGGKPGRWYRRDLTSYREPSRGD